MNIVATNHILFVEILSHEDVSVHLSVLKVLRFVVLDVVGIYDKE